MLGPILGESDHLYFRRQKLAPANLGKEIVNFLVIGHEGYIGQGLCHELSKRHHVIGWGRQDDIFSLTKEKLETHSIDAVVNSPTFGHVLSVRPMRRMQLNVRFRF